MKIIMKYYNLDSFKEKDIYTWEEIISKIEDLECELEMAKEELKNYKQDVEDNYMKIPIARMVSINDRDFV